jgi:Ca-activated chloride channel homolog
MGDLPNFMSDQDQLGLTTFSSSADVLTSISPLGPKRQDILSRIDGINASGETLLFDTIGQQFQALQQFPSKHIKAIVVLTDGQDNKRGITLFRLLASWANLSCPLQYSLAYAD